MKRLLPTLALGTLLSGAAEAKDNQDAVAYSPQTLSGMCDPEVQAVTSTYPELKAATADVNAVFAEALRDPSNKEMAAVLSNELLDALYEKMAVTEEDPKAVLSVLGDLQLELDRLMTNVNYGDAEQVTDAIDEINAYVQGLENLSVLLSSLSNEKGKAMTRKQLLERYDANLNTVNRAWRVDNALTALDELNLPTGWDCTPIVLAYGSTGQWPTSVDELEALDTAGELDGWTTPEISVITGPQYTIDFDYELDQSTNRDSRQSLSEAYEMATAAIADVVGDLQPLVAQFERRQKIEFAKDEEPAVELVWSAVPATE